LIETRRAKMEKSNLVPFVRPNLDILFVGLNPAKGSSDNQHYFSVNQAFWDQLHASGLITKCVDKSNADTIVFGDTSINFQGRSFGITDLVTEIALSDSTQIRPMRKHCENLERLIIDLSPKVAILLHGKVLDEFLSYLGHEVPPTNVGRLGKLIPNCQTMFFSIAFPHGNAISSDSKVSRYLEVKHYLLKW
jgi:hypothetical protein